LRAHATDPARSSGSCWYQVVDLNVAKDLGVHVPLTLAG
jgi:hypothetical protein